MSFRIIGNLCRSTRKNLIEEKLSCFANTKRSMMNVTQKHRASSESSQGDHYGSDSSIHTTVFKRMFKKYKRRNPAPDLSQVVDPHATSSSNILHFQQLRVNDVSDEELQMLGLKPLSEWKLATLPGREGLYIFPSALKEDASEMWLQRAVNYAEPPHVTNLTAHGSSPEKNVLKNAGKSLRWTTLGVDYNWDTKQYPLSGDPLPTELVQFADVITRILKLGPMFADATIVNYYPPKSTLSPHIDRSERTMAPLVSLSLGQSAIYLTGGESLDDEVIPLWLQSGDVLVMHGAQRLDPVVSDFANSSRANITIRQVNPVDKK
ncbi:unnamed protein product [Cylicocyclus nassatus]|uniref:Fe2OG dioxygenase domain-containing protein n=1 Tax=Cylicocyclus nassatus TaxID=53992 RepID=A0AA36H1Z9_CYLNA|nr:unnamed protein product [Cylicocyclus nassatus]